MEFLEINIISRILYILGDLNPIEEQRLFLKQILWQRFISFWGWRFYGLANPNSDRLSFTFLANLSFLFLCLEPGLLWVFDDATYTENWDTMVARFFPRGQHLWQYLIRDFLRFYWGSPNLMRKNVVLYSVGHN